MGCLLWRVWGTVIFRTRTSSSLYRIVVPLLFLFFAGQFQRLRLSLSRCLAKNPVRRFLGLRRCQPEELPVLPQVLQPMVNIGSVVVEGRGRDAGRVGQIGRP